MGLFTTQENRIRCGKCNTEFDLNKNSDGCPMCGFGKKTAKEGVTEVKTISQKIQDEQASMYFQIPPSLRLSSGKVISND